MAGHLRLSGRPPDAPVPRVGPPALLCPTSGGRISDLSGSVGVSLSYDPATQPAGGSGEEPSSFRSRNPPRSVAVQAPLRNFRVR